MLKRSFIIAQKDLKLSVSGGQGLVQAVLLGLLLIFMFSLSKPFGGIITPQAAGAIFWLASVFGLVLVFNDLFSIEEANGARIGILSSPAPVHAVWIGKGMAGLVLLFVSQLVFLPATAAFLGQTVHGPWWLLWVTSSFAGVIGRHHLVRVVPFTGTHHGIRQMVGIGFRLRLPVCRSWAVSVSLCLQR